MLKKNPKELIVHYLGKKALEVTRQIHLSTTKIQEDVTDVKQSIWTENNDSFFVFLTAKLQLLFK